MYFVSGKRCKGISFFACEFSSSKIHLSDYPNFNQQNKKSFSIFQKILLYFIAKIHNRLLCCNHTCYCVNMVSVTLASRYITPASRYNSRYQSRSTMYIRGLIPRNSVELADSEAVLIYKRV